MSNPAWGVGMITWVDGDPGLALIYPDGTRVESYLQPNLQAIPGEYENNLGNVKFATDGMWYITSGDHDAPAGIVYFAPYSNPVFVEVARLDDITGEGYGYYSHRAYPGGLAVCQPGSRYVSLLNPQGVIHQQELPDGFIGDDYGWRQLEIYDIVYSPGDKKIALVFVLESDTSPRVTAVGITTLESPGNTLHWVDTLYVVGERQEQLRAVSALVGRVFGGDVVLASGAVTGADKGQSFQVTLPDNEVNPGLSIDRYACSIFDTGTAVWEPSGVTAQQVHQAWYMGDRTDYDVDALPIPTTFPYELQVRFAPKLTTLTAARILVDGVPFETSVGGLSSWSNLYASARQKDPIFLPGEVYGITIELTRGGAGTTSRSLTLTAGVDSEGFLTGYEDTVSDDYGEVSSRIVASLSGVTYLADYIRCWPRLNRWGGTLILLPLPVTPPFWTAFERTAEVLDVGGVIPPDPDPDPGPVESYEMELVAGSVFVSDWDATYVGFGLEWGDLWDVDAADFGNLTPNEVSFGYIRDISVEQGGDELYVVIHGLYGVTSMVVEINGVPYIAEVSDSSGTTGITSIPPDLIQDGQTYNIRLYLEGDLRSEP